MMTAVPTAKRYEEYAHVLDYVPRGHSTVIHGREGPIGQVIGEDHLTLLEVLGIPEMPLSVGERVCIGKEGRTKVLSVLGKLNYEDLTENGRRELPNALECIIRAREATFISYFNQLQPLTPRLHALELIPGIGKTFMRGIISQRERSPFKSFEDLETRVGLREPVKLLARRIIEEISGGSRVHLFVGR